MKAKVVYYSRSGNTKLLAEAIAKGVNTEAISVSSANSNLDEDTEILFVGGALYAYGLDKNLKEYLQGLDKKNVKKAVVFSTSWLSKHSIDLIKNALKEKGINVEEEYIYAKNTPSEDVLKNAEEKAKSFIEE